jgi:AGZA family xanthine/uracil permease-like MFS transporter
MVGGGIALTSGSGLTLYPITAPILILVGLQLMRSLGRLDWDRPADTVPALLTAIGIPLTYSIADGLALGFISYTAICLLKGRIRDLNPLLLIVTILFMVRFIWIKL